MFLKHGLSNKEMKNILDQLNGNKILIRGNHDELPNEDYYKLGFKYVANYINIDEYFFCHFPLYLSRWTTKEEQIYRKIFDNLNCTTVYHGHVHNKDPELWESDGIKRINVCIDFKPNNYEPLKITNSKIKQHIQSYL